MNIMEQLAAHAHELAKTVGGRLRVEVWAWVALEPEQPLEIRSKCCIGRTANEIAAGYGGTVETAFVKCVEQWEKVGKPTEPETPQSRLEKEAAKLGFVLMPVEIQQSQRQAAAIGAALARGATTLAECTKEAR